MFVRMHSSQATLASPAMRPPAQDMKLDATSRMPQPVPDDLSHFAISTSPSFSLLPISDVHDLATATPASGASSLGSLKVQTLAFSIRALSHSVEAVAPYIM